MTLTCQAIARPHDCCHRACKQPKPARSKAMPVTKDSHHNDRCSRPTRHSQPNTTTSPVSKAPAARLLRLFSADAWKAKYSALLEIFKQFLKGINAPVRSSAEFPNLYHARARAILTSCHNSTGRKSSWSACSRTFRFSSHNSTGPLSCPFRGKSSSEMRQTPWLLVVQGLGQFVVSWPSCDHLPSFVKFQIQLFISLF